MAKINFHKEPIKLPESTQKIDSIVGKAFLENYEERFQKADEIAKKQHKTNKMAKDILIGETKKEEN